MSPFRKSHILKQKVLHTVFVPSSTHGYIYVLQVGVVCVSVTVKTKYSCFVVLQM